MLGNAKRGFTLIEVVVALAIIALVATAIAPTFIRRTRLDRVEFVKKLAALSQLGWQQALVTRKLHRLYFDFKKRTVTLEVATDQKEADGEPVCEPLKRFYITTTIAIPSQLEIMQFINEGFDDMSGFTGKATAATWFYIMPDGITQHVTINMLDKQDLLENKEPRQVGLVLNPFSARFDVYDTFQK